jgi:hypothetical protein
MKVITIVGNPEYYTNSYRFTRGHNLGNLNYTVGFELNGIPVTKTEILTSLHLHENSIEFFLKEALEENSVLRIILNKDNSLIKVYIVDGEGLCISNIEIELDCINKIKRVYKSGNGDYTHLHDIPTIPFINCKGQRKQAVLWNDFSTSFQKELKLSGYDFDTLAFLDFKEAAYRLKQIINRKFVEIHKEKRLLKHKASLLEHHVKSFENSDKVE